MARKAPPADKRKVISRQHLGEDLELHTCRVVVAGEILVDVRQFIPSLATYGRGVTFPRDCSIGVINALNIIDGRTAGARA